MLGFVAASLELDILRVSQVNLWPYYLLLMWSQEVNSLCGGVCTTRILLRACLECGI